MVELECAANGKIAENEVFFVVDNPALSEEVKRFFVGSLRVNGYRAGTLLGKSSSIKSKSFVATPRPW
jgi:hypothetical protein